MGLRLREGIDADAIADRFGLASGRRLDAGRPAGRLGPSEAQRPRIALTASGRLVLDHILGEIAAEPA